MKKIKFFFIASALTLLTVGVFASKHKFVNAGLVAYLPTASAYVQIETSTLGTDMVTSPTGAGIQAKISDQSGTSFFLYQFDGNVTYTPVYAAATW